VTLRGALGLLCLVACTPDRVPQARDAGPNLGSTGCGKVAPSGVTTRTLRVQATDRTYVLSIPAGYDGKTPLALVFAYHGLGANGADMRSYLDLERVAGGKALFVYPDGLPAEGGTGWELGATGRDVAMFDAVKVELDAAYCVDDRRVFGVGFSYGAWMASALACARGDIVRAIGAMSGGPPEGRCRGPVPVWISHGKQDPAESISEGQKSRDAWIATNGAGAAPVPTAPAPCVVHGRGKAPVVWCAFDGGHAIPDFGRQALWEFFASR